ncbi:predicted protein [Postia placenta Mad-698-R]|nr:predicted protein [Postia placenta Mad-698-R]
MQHSKGPSLPADIWLKLFDGLAEEGDYETIAACAKVCRGIWKWSNRYFRRGSWGRSWTFNDEEDVSRARKSLARMGRRAWPPLRSVVVVGEQDSKAIPHMAMLASTLAAGNWARIAELRIENAVWPSSHGAADASIFRDLSCLGWVATLVLDNVRFPSIVAFGALVTALPRLKTLCIHNVTFPRSSNLFGPRTFSDFRLLPKLELDTIDLGHVAKKTSDFTDDAWSHHVELLAFMTAVSSGSAPRTLARPGLRSIVVTLDRPSDTNCLYFPRVIHCLIDLDHHLRITKVSISAELFVSASDTPQILLNKVLKHAGPSLDHVTLHNMSAKAYHLSLLRKTLFCHLNLSENTNLKSLELMCSLRTTWCYDYVLELLSSVNSQCMSCIKLDFSPWKGRRLRDILPNFIAVLSLLPVFEHLKNIVISLRSIVRTSRGRMEKRDADLTEELWPLLTRAARPNIFGITKGRARIGSFWDDEANSWKYYDIKTDESDNSVVIEVPRFENIGLSLDFADVHTVVASSAFANMEDNMGKQQRLDRKLSLLAESSKESDYSPEYVVPKPPTDGLPEITSRPPPNLDRFGFGSLRRFTGLPFTASRQRRRQLKCYCRRRKPTFLFSLRDIGVRRRVCIDDDTK